MLKDEEQTLDENRGNEAISQSPPDARIDVCANTTGDTSDPKKGDAKATEYVVDHIVSDVIENGETEYLVRWYRNSKDDDTLEPSANIPHHFIVRY